MREPWHDTVYCECKRSVRRLLERVCLWVKGAELGEGGRPLALVLRAAAQGKVFCSLRLGFGSDKEKQCVPASRRRPAQTPRGS